MFNYWLYIFSFPIGVYLALKVFHNRKKYFWYEYAALFVLPIITLVMLYKTVGNEVLVVFLIWLVFGTMMEILAGLVYLQLTGRHLWVYERLPIANRTTSLLSLPFWSFFGTGMYALTKIFLEFAKGL